MDPDYSKLFPSYSENNVGGSTAYDWFTGFFRSGLESIPELIGITPSTDTLQWRQDHPVGGFISELGGMAVPYTGWYKATKALGRFDKAVEAIGNIQKAPILTGAAREAARLAPFELGRVGVSQIVGDQPFGDMLGSAALNLATGAGIGGLLHGVAAAGVREPPLATIFPGLDISLPLTLQLRTAKGELGGLAGEELVRAQGAVANLAKAVREEELRPQVEKYVAPLAYEGKGAKGLAQQLERLFRTGNNEPEHVLVRKRFTKSARDFGDDWLNEAAQAGLKEGFEDSGQYFRHISFKTGGATEQELLDAFNKHNAGHSNYEELTSTLKGLTQNSRAQNVAKRVDGTLTGAMTDVGDGWFMTREADDGMFVLAKKYQGVPGQGTISDKWMLFKTDAPGKFLPEQDTWAKVVTKREAWQPTARLADDGGFVYNATRRFGEEFGFRNYAAAQNSGKLGDLITKALPRVNLAQNEVVARTGEVIREYLAPAAHQFKKSARANYVNTLTKVAYDAAETEAQGIMYGVAKSAPNKSLFFSSLSNDLVGTHGLRPVKEIVDALSEAEVAQLWKVWRNGVKPAELDQWIAKGEISPLTAAVAKELAKTDAVVWNSVNAAEKATGNTVTKQLEGHYGLSRKWEGDTRIVIRDEGSRPVALAAGPNRRAAQQAAKEMVLENPGWRQGEEFSISQMHSIPKDVAPIVRSPSFVLERQGLRGYKWDKEPWTKDELLEAYSDAMRSRMKYQANLTVSDQLAGHLHRLAVEDPAAYRMVTARMNDYAGVKSAANQWQNQVVDKVLAPILGTNSADKIVSLTNSTIWHLQLGGMNLRYPITNALTFLQTVLPEAVYMLSAPQERIAGRYSYFAAHGGTGPIGGMAVLSPFKLMRDSVREMRKPGAELLEAFTRAQNERVIDPRMVEEFIGESAVKVKDLRTAISSGGGFVQWLRALSEFLPAQSERLSRGHAFTTGYLIGRDHLGLQGEALYRLAKQFTENTMYLYGGADRPRVFTTPAGSSFGLFKNWMFNYLATMAEYSGEAARGNFAPLLWQTAGTAAVGGMAATPLYAVADVFSRMFADKGVLQILYDGLGEGADGVMYGLPALLTGASLYSSVSSPAANPARDANQLWNMVLWDRMKLIGKTLGEGMDHWRATGEHPGKDSHVRELLARTFAPASIYRIFGAAEENVINGLSSGYPIIKNVSGGDRLLYALGFNPVELDRGMAVANEMFAKRDARKATVSRLGDAWAEAQAEGNAEKMGLILREAMIVGVDASSVIKSGLQRMQKGEKSILERSFKPADVIKFDAVLNPGGRL